MNLQRKGLAADLNSNFLTRSTKTRAILEMLNRNGMSLQLNTPSTIHGTQIDVIFTSFSVESAGNYICTLPSPHDPLYLRYVEN